MSNRLKRKTLNAEEIERECLAIKARGFDSVLLVTGEHEHKVGLAHFREVMPIIRRHFSTVGMEVQPLSAGDEYAELKSLGLDAVMVYQRPTTPPPMPATICAATSGTLHGASPRRTGRLRRDRQNRVGGAHRSLLRLARRQLLCRRAPELA